MTTSAPPLRDVLAALAADVHAIREALRPSTAPATARGGDALALIGTVAAELREAARALESSAVQLREDGKGWRAAQAKQAAVRAQQAADDLLEGP